MLFVSFDQPDSSITGQLLVTNYRLRFESVLHHQRPNVMNVWDLLFLRKKKNHNHLDDYI